MTQTHHYRSFFTRIGSRHWLTIGVWLGAIFLVVLLLQRRDDRLTSIGIVQSEQRQIAALATGRITHLSVDHLDTVRAGTPLVILDDAATRAALASATATTARLRADLAAARVTLASESRRDEVDYRAEARRFAFEIIETRLKLLETRVQLETDRVVRQSLSITLERLDRLQDTALATQFEVERAQLRVAETSARIAANEKLLTQLQQDLAAATARAATFVKNDTSKTATDDDALLAPHFAAIAEQEARVAEIAGSLETLVLRSPIDGIVQQIDRTVGEAVRPGETILRIVATKPTYIDAYVTERIAVVAPSRAVEFAADRGARSQRFVGTVRSVSAAIEEIPLRLWQDPARPEYGRRVRIDIPMNNDLIPGEVVAIRQAPTKESAS